VSEHSTLRLSSPCSRPFAQPSYRPEPARSRARRTNRSARNNDVRFSPWDETGILGASLHDTFRRWRARRAARSTKAPYSYEGAAARDVLLRAPVNADRDARRALGVTRDIARMFGTEAPTDRTITRATATRWFEQLGADGVIEWVVEARDRFVGTAPLHTIDYDAQTAFYAIGLLDPTVLDQGVGRVATRRVCGHGFDVLGLREIRLRVLDFNERARRCYTSVGFIERKSIPSGVVDQGRDAEDIIMVRVRSEPVLSLCGFRGGSQFMAVTLSAATDEERMVAHNPIGAWGARPERPRTDCAIARCRRTPIGSYVASRSVEAGTASRWMGRRLTERARNPRR
jgi:[ribosomal protein S5]-alanine N-acetyltransferase